MARRAARALRRRVVVEVVARAGTGEAARSDCSSLVLELGLLLALIRRAELRERARE